MLKEMMTRAPADDGTVASPAALDAETHALVRLAGIITAGSEIQMRASLVHAAAACRP